MTDPDRDPNPARQWGDADAGKGAGGGEDFDWFRDEYGTPQRFRVFDLNDPDPQPPQEDPDDS